MGRGLRGGTAKARRFRAHPVAVVVPVVAVDEDLLLLPLLPAASCASLSLFVAPLPVGLSFSAPGRGRRVLRLRRGGHAPGRDGTGCASGPRGRLFELGTRETARRRTRRERRRRKPSRALRCGAEFRKDEGGGRGRFGPPGQLSLGRGPEKGAGQFSKE